MINTIADIDDIEFEQRDPGNVLYESIKKRGLAIAVKVNRKEDGTFQCIDGHKRLTACMMLKDEYPKFRRIPVMLMNDYSKAGSSFWGNTQNHH
ncbi:MAG: ParB/RepB/Spo0J family partition protein [Solobacterium sp.]|nr:ParB/RepB/Spo0J family partition protein [Solobacterium sp.]